MKMSTQTQAALQTAIQALITPQVIEAYENGKFDRAERCTDLNVRFRWDVFYAARRSIPEQADEELRTLNDSHIDTALRSIVKPITRKY